MKILVYSSVFYPNVGGIENLNLDLINEFVNAGHQVKVVTEQKQTKPNPFKNVEIVEYKKLISQIRLFFWSDIVYMPNITLKILWLFLFNPFKKFVVSHNDFHIAFHKKWKANLKLFFIHKADANISVSKSIADYFKINADVIYNCYNNEVFKIYPEVERKMDFVFVGRLVTYKGCIVLLESFVMLGGNYNLTIIGDGPESRTLRKIVNRHRLNDRVRFLGFMHGEELAKKLNEHKVMVVCPIDKEGFGIVALEGLACGCKLIVADAGGLPEAANGFGCKFPMKDVVALKDCMKKVISSEDLNSDFDEKVKYLSTLTKQEVAKKYLQVFTRVLNK